MCVCMDGPARVSVMYLYMILHTYINLDLLRSPRCVRIAKIATLRYVHARRRARNLRGPTRSLIFAIVVVIEIIGRNNNHIHRHDVQVT